MATARQRADRLVEQLFGRVRQDAPAERSEPEAPLSVARRLDELQRSRQESRRITRKLRMF